MQKISFESARSALAETKLLLDSQILADRSGYPLSRMEEIRESDIFIAIQGQNVDAHDLIDAAVQNGAALLVVSDREKLASALTRLSTRSLSWLLVTEGRAAWTVLTALSYQNPQKKLRFLGVTGTDGKSSTVWMSAQLLRKHGQKCLSLGTLGAYDGKEHWPLNHTTPDPPVFFSALSKGVHENISSVVMEVSSHSLIQEKVCNIPFATAALTSFSREH